MQLYIIYNIIDLLSYVLLLHIINLLIGKLLYGMCYYCVVILYSLSFIPPQSPMSTWRSVGYLAFLLPLLEPTQLITTTWWQVTGVHMEIWLRLDPPLRLLLLLLPPPPPLPFTSRTTSTQWTVSFSPWRRKYILYICIKGFNIN